MGVEHTGRTLFQAVFCPSGTQGPRLNRLDWTELFFSSTGRIGRVTFVGCAALLLLLALAYRIGVSDGVRAWTSFLVGCGLLFSAACVLSKRLHDRGRAGWWAFLVVFAVIGGLPHPHSLRQIAFVAIMIWVVFDLGFGPGQRGANRFGPGPTPRGGG
jgi:uncharacterized membrane protein YhaH (DUF805 family)